ncbi:cation efflux system protein [Catellatospora sp. IY07-71]|uniref:efflux RND transporter permease subunit n=1 Tax=Catellatospora sp. IY07-71 TaxID=2728827 RepID=UPI001BB44FAB|nr:efflux RND transporter permease subunit [Catellatospora sp. IY07-71]BCJ77778.1 cation efflux system protein [Catellatospora sp. IY07-71]
MRWIVGWSLKFRYIVVALTAFLIFFGIQQLGSMKVDVFPEFAPPKVEIHTVAIGLAPTEVEQLITVPLEQSFNGIPGVKTVRSRSVEQLSQIVLLFEPGTDLLTARQLVAERIAAVTPTLPSWAAPPVMLQPLSATSRVLKIGLSSSDPKIDMMDLSMAAYWKIRARLLRVPGVANVPIWGERLEMLQVQADPKRMAEQKVSLETVMTATADALDAGLQQYSAGHYIGRGGWVEDSAQRMGVRHIQPIVTHDDLANLPITTRDGRTIKLSDVAYLVRDHQPLIGDAVINEGDGLMLIVEKLPWANTLDVTQGVEAALKELEPGLTGITVDPQIFRPATFIEDAINNLTKALVLGAILMVVMLCLFLYSWRTAVISVVAIPVSLLAAILVLHWRGTTINTMVLAGFVIALGDIVDDAIVDIENVVRRLRQARAEGDPRSTARVILDASMEVRGAIVYATVIEVVAILPIFMLAGLSGSFFRPLALSYALALLASMVVALTVTPALSLIMFRSPKSLQQRESPLVPPLKRGYEWLLSRIVRRPLPVYAGVAVVTVLGVLTLPLLGQSLLPNFKERDFLMHWLTKPDTSLQEEVRTTKLVNGELLTIPGVRNAGSHIGNALLGDEPYGVYFGENWISVDRNADYDKTLASVKDVVNGYPGIYRDVLTYLKERIREVLTGTSEPITIRIYGQDLDQLRAKAEEVDKILGETPGVGEHYVDFQDNVPQLKVEVDLAAAQKHGVKPGDVRRAAAWLMAGEEAGDVYVGGRAYDVQLWSPPANRQTITDLRNLPIDTPSGGQVRLDDVANVSIVAVPNVVHHEDLLRDIDVGASLDGTRDLGSVARDIQSRLDKMDWPLEFRAELLGEYTERQAAQQRLLLAAIVAGVAILLLLQLAYRSWRLAVLSFLILPIALVGGLIAAFLGGGIVSLGSLVGFLTVFGIVARNGIMLISHCQHLEQEEGVEFGPDLVLRAAKERLVPILMTVLTTGLALIPLLVTGSIPGQEIEHPMAVVIIGGLITATLLNLFVVPSLYLRFAKSRRRAPSHAAPEPAPGA